ncbi:MAG: TAXI family TRAP transporter solute-binding subunit [Limisphaerales bacterium]
MAEPQKTLFSRLAAPFMEIFGLSRGMALAVVLVAGLAILFAVFWFFHSAPPHTIIMTGGAPGSSFETYAEKYRVILARKGVKLQILPSQGSLENLQRLGNPKLRVDVGFVQGGVTNAPGSDKLVSLGSISYEPLLVFYRSATPVNLLSGLSGRRVAIGAVGSGTRSLALQLLALNGIKPGGATTFLDLDGNDAANALLAGSVDAVFLMGDTTSVAVMRQLETAPNVQLFDFTQADGYVRRISYVNKLDLPQGSIDFGRNMPAHDVSLIGPTVEILARSKLHPALSDLLLEAAKETHGGPGMFKRRDEFPALLQHDFPISPDATRYFKSGKKFFYGLLPFWLASLVSRIVVVFVPLVVLMIPALRIIPAIFKWRMQMRINRWYRELLALERSMAGEASPAGREKLMAQFGRIENEVNKMKVPTSFAGPFYDLRGNIQFVRGRLLQNTGPH